MWHARALCEKTGALCPVMALDVRSQLQTWYGQIHANRKWFIWWTEHTVAKMCFVFRIRNKWEGKDRSGSIRINVQLKLLSLFVVFDWDGELQSGKVPRRKRPVVWKKWKLFLFIFCWFVSLWMTFHIKSSIIYTWSYKRCIFSVANQWILQWYVYLFCIDSPHIWDEDTYFLISRRISIGVMINAMINIHDTARSARPS